MDITIHINLDNAAFEEPGADQEVAAMLSKAAANIGSGKWSIDYLTTGPVRLLDSNGNACGTLEVTE